MNNALATNNPIAVGSIVRIEKGCKARGVDKGTSARIDAIESLGADYSYSVRVVLKFVNGFKAGKTVTFFARHINRLSDTIINLNDGNPSNTIQLLRKS